jgi:Ras-like protein family member 10B
LLLEHFPVLASVSDHNRSYRVALRTRKNTSDVINSTRRPVHTHTHTHTTKSGTRMTNDQAIQIAVIGDRAVGKTSIIRQWLYNDYSSTYSSTRLATYYFTSLFNGHRLFHIRVIDTPRFDRTNHTDPQQDWVRMYCFRRAHLFLLIFDINREETFTYIKHIYRDIIRIRYSTDSNMNIDMTTDEPYDTSRMNIPVIVIGNKVDFISTDMRFSNLTLTHFRDIQQYVKKHFQADTILCSAKYHWHLVVLFKDVCHLLETVEDTTAKQVLQQTKRRNQQQQQQPQPQPQEQPQYQQDEQQRKHCTVM